jgi:hypothetical protein
MGWKVEFKMGTPRKRTDNSRKSKQAIAQDPSLELSSALDQDHQLDLPVVPRVLDANPLADDSATLLKVTQAPPTAQQIEVTIQYLKTRSPLLDLVTVQLTQRLVTIYRGQVASPGSSSSSTTLPHFEVIRVVGQ